MNQSDHTDQTGNEPAIQRRTHRFITDISWWRYQSATADTVVAGSPLRLFRFAPEARRLLQVLEAGQQLDDDLTSTQSNQVLDRLLDAEAIHPLFDHRATPSTSIAGFTVVIPTKDTSDTHLKALIASLPAGQQVIVIDDGSATPVGPIDGVIIHRLAQSRGPAAARNVGLNLVKTPLVCFIDSDIDLGTEAQESSFWAPVLFHFDDPRVGLVAPRVQSKAGSSVLERYEMTDSPIDMGRQPSRLHRRGRLSYVPSALILVRTDELRRHGGFDESLRFGEDVDLIWRFTGRGVICRYEPQVTVYHRPRHTWLALGRQRFFYGSSAAHLDARHPGSLTPLRLSPWTASAWVSALMGHPFIATLVTAVSIARLRRSLPKGTEFTLERDIIATRIVLRGTIQAGQALAQAVNRPWWPLIALASVGSKRARHLWFIAAVVPALWRWKQRQSELDPWQYTLARVFDDASYGAGVWAGVLKLRRVGPLQPELTLKPDLK